MVSSPDGVSGDVAGQYFTKNRARSLAESLASRQWRTFKHHSGTTYHVAPDDFELRRKLLASYVAQVEDADTAPLSHTLPPADPDFAAGAGPSNQLYTPLREPGGHNIAAMAVDSTTGQILGIEFNNCLAFRSTTHHAEERLIDRLFATADLTIAASRTKYNKLLNNVVLYV